MQVDDFIGRQAFSGDGLEIPAGKTRVPLSTQFASSPLP